ncbi:hypothetical protein EES47_12745 [Streptomyces sp. ADI98-12]|uniref:Uncharacterized protein n=1 Tax=Streptomyces griseus TaxID=1911 RepID=A0A380MRI9_STRGR|nr:putative membrane protein [Streptomyces sp. DSM 41037]RPK89171.1 hypothetical protein EES47_12745 [Streptomyces sp. ADI98-12]SUO93937.1 Uncharacterised protein [Streptomyces griseus]
MESQSVRKVVLLGTLVVGLVLITLVAGAIAWVDATR